MTFDDVRHIALTFPNVTEHTVFGGPTLRIGKRLLACIAKIDPDTALVKVQDQAERDYWLTTKPEVFYLTDHYEGFDCLLFRMSLADLEDIRVLLEQSWLTYAPKRLVTAYQAKKRAE